MNVGRLWAQVVAQPSWKCLSIHDSIQKAPDIMSVVAHYHHRVFAFLEINLYQKGTKSLTVLWQQSTDFPALAVCDCWPSSEDLYQTTRHCLT